MRFKKGDTVKILDGMMQGLSGVIADVYEKEECCSVSINGTNYYFYSALVGSIDADIVPLKGWKKFKYWFKHIASQPIIFNPCFNVK